MKSLKRLSILTVLLSTFFTFNIFAMENDIYNPPRQTPLTDAKNASLPNEVKWIWLGDNSCVQFNAVENMKKERIEQMFNWGMLKQWAENGKDGRGIIKTRDTYSGKWSQSEDGIWSFTFDDCTIPVGVTKIDGVLYAFNGFGELKAGYEYYTGCKTEADGIVNADSAEFKQWLEMQYLPDCTSRK